MGEVFLEEEIKILEKHTDRIVIIPINPSGNITRPISDKIKIEKLTYFKTNWFKIKSLRYLFSLHVITELNLARLHYKKRINLKLIKNIISAYAESTTIKKFIEKKFKKDQFNTIYSYWMDEKALAISRLNLNAKKICRAHGWDLYFDRSEINYLPFKRSILLTINEVHFISKNGLNYFINTHKVINLKKLYLSYLGTNVYNFNNLKKNITSNKFTILTNGYIYPNKRIELVIETLSKLKFKAHWIHIGNGYEEGFFKQIKILASEILDTNQNISYEFKGQLSNLNVHKLLYTNQIDIFMNLSQSEGIPVSIMEAISYKIPIIATNVGGVSEIVKENLNGYLLNPNPNTDHISKILTNFYMLNSEERQKYRNASYSIWENNFNAEKNYGIFTELIKK